MSWGGREVSCQVGEAAAHTGLNAHHNIGKLHDSSDALIHPAQSSAALNKSFLVFHLCVALKAFVW